VTIVPFKLSLDSTSPLLAEHKASYSSQKSHKTFALCCELLQSFLQEGKLLQKNKIKSSIPATNLVKSKKEERVHYSDLIMCLFRL
jgi:hypothetical protein